MSLLIVGTATLRAVVYLVAAILVWRSDRRTAGVLIALFGVSVLFATGAIAAVSVLALPLAFWVSERFVRLADGKKKRLT
jgi:hypothetical protein